MCDAELETPIDLSSFHLRGMLSPFFYTALKRDTFNAEQIGEVIEAHRTGPENEKI